MMKERFEGKVDRSPTCWLWRSAIRKDGYGRFRIEGAARLAHRVSYELYVGAIPRGMCVCHHCDNPSCVNPKHLFLGSQSENMLDCSRKGRISRLGLSRPGSTNHNSKLTEEAVLEIRKRVSSGEKQYEVAKEFGVSASLLSQVVAKQRWAHVAEVP